MADSADTGPSPDAWRVFESIAERLDAGDPSELEGFFGRRPDLEPELREIYRGWRRVDRLFGSLRVDSSILDSVVREAEVGEDPPDRETLEVLDRLTNPARALERYEIRGRIGSGGMGEVLRVHDRELERDLAMKVVGTRASGGRLLRRFLAEARLTARLEHPGIVPVHDMGIDAEGRLWFTMPLVRGLTLGEVFECAREERDGWSRARVLEVLLRVCDTIDFAHASGVIHRDLKPSNILVGRFGESYVVDWGLARAARGVGHEGVAGTPAYMSPEQALGRLEAADSRSDVYSLGAILYHLLADRIPYAGTGSSQAVLEALRAGPPAPLEREAPDAPEELLAICAKAMARKPSDRYPGMRELAEDLRAWMSGRVVRAYESGAWPELRKWIGRNRGFAAAVAASIAMALGGLAATSWVQAAGKAEILRLADVRRLADLETRAEDLWPATPEKIDAMERWVSDARVLLEHSRIHERTLREMEARILVEPEEQWTHDVLGTLVEKLALLADPDPSKGALASVLERLEFARQIRTRSVEDRALEWESALASIADAQQSPAYGGLSIVPQLGLIPLGRDPSSGLWEFADLASGTPPVRRTDGELVLGAGTGLVLVLIPGGSYFQGSQAPIPGKSSELRTDPMARENESPARERVVEPFFLSKYEMTRAQWLRAQGDPSPSARTEDSLQPAAGVSWEEASRAMRHLGLGLPTEMQWEYAARAGTITRWWTGNDQGNLAGKENAGYGIDATLRYDDGWPEIAPVNGLPGNPWGLVHVLGNVEEWTSDDYEEPLRSGNAPGQAPKVVRGGSFKSWVRDLRCAFRTGVPPEIRSSTIGVRPMRAVEP